jgi:alpha-ketoglutarate-dependent 2,4-dichlorophenoxyacetate dioxygenase
VGGNTEFCAMRAAYTALPQRLKDTIEDLVAEHSIVHSRSLVDPNVLSAAQKAESPPVKQRLVRVNPINGRKALYIGAHASHIVGWPLDKGRALLKELTALGTRPEFQLSHAWREGDLIVWDNRAVLHRATAYDATQHKRLMQRTTVAGDAPTVAQ